MTKPGPKTGNFVNSPLSGKGGQSQNNISQAPFVAQTTKFKRGNTQNENQLQQNSLGNTDMITDLIDQGQF